MHKQKRQGMKKKIRKQKEINKTNKSEIQDGFVYGCHISSNKRNTSDAVNRVYGKI
jgi:hypothetical protein